MEKKKSFARGWGLIVFSFLGFFFLTYLDVVGPNVFINALAEKGFNAATLLMVHSIGTVCGAVLGIFLGEYIERHGAKKVFCLMVFITSVNFILMAVATTQAWACVHVWLNQTLSLGYCLLPILSLISKWFPRKKGVMFGIVTAGNIGGTVVLLTLASNILAAKGLLASNGIIAGMFIAYGVVGIFLIKETPQECGLLPDNMPMTAEEEAAIVAEKSYVSPWTFKEMLTSFPVMAIIISFGFMTIANIGAQVQGLNIMVEGGLDPTKAAVFLAASGVFGFIGSILSGIIDQKTNSHLATIILFSIAIVALIALAFAKGLGVGVGFMFVCFVTGSLNNLLPSHIMTRCGAKNFDALWKLASPLTRAMSCLGAMSMSVSLNRTGGYHMGCVLILLCGIIAIVLFIASGRTGVLLPKSERRMKA